METIESVFLTQKGNDTYWYCGGNQSSCANVGMDKDDNRTYHMDGQYVNFDSKKWVCCGGTQDGWGKYLELKKYEDDADKKEIEWKNTANGAIAYYEKLVSVTLEGGGKCTYKARINGCGKELTKPCTEATKCTDGYVLRNKTCVPPCEDGYDFESTTSNKCVECPTTLYQGSVVEGGTTYCKKCNKNTQFMDVTQNKCVSKSEYESIGHAVLAKCALCENNETAIKCVKCFSSDDENCKSSFSKSCLIY